MRPLATGRCAVRDIKEIRCYSPNAAHRVAFAQEMTDTLGVELIPTGSASAAIAQADIVMCATNSIAPVFFEKWLEPGMHVSAIKTPEIESSALKRAARIGLHYGQHSPQRELAAGVTPPDQGQGRGWSATDAIDFSTSPLLPSLVVGETKGRENDGEITCFINDLGLGLQFAAVAGLVHRKAVDAGLGRDTPTDWFPEDVHP